MNRRASSTESDGMPSADPGVGYQGTIGRTLQESTPWWPEPTRAPAGAPDRQGAVSAQGPGSRTGVIIACAAPCRDDAGP